MSLDTKRLGLVFESRPDIFEGIKRAADTPERVQLFNAIGNHIFEKLHAAEEPAHKKRRVETSTNGANGPSSSAAAANVADEQVLLVIKEISVSVPQRKKFELCFTTGHIYARAPNTTDPIPAITYTWKDLEYIFYLPVPEKAQVQHNYVLFPRGTSIPSKTAPSTSEPLVFTIPSTAPKEGTIAGTEASSAAAVSDTYKDLFDWALKRHLSAANNPIGITASNPAKFQSAIRSAHRPNEKAVHVSGYRGSKDGFIFFLPNGILWAFKKPLIFIPISRIASVSYTNILQITFNILVEVLPDPSSVDQTNEEYELSMIDQQDYNNIDDYVKTHRLQDRSMAEQRKGQLQLTENKRAAAEAVANGETADPNGNTELEKAALEAEQQMQDDEDEDEEDYDPGSDGESEGSGSSSEEEDSDAEGGEGEADDDDEEDGEGEEEDEDAVEGGEEAVAEVQNDDDDDEDMADVKEEPVVAQAPAAPRAGGFTAVKAAPKGWAAFGSK